MKPVTFRTAPSRPMVFGAGTPPKKSWWSKVKTAGAVAVVSGITGLYGAHYYNFSPPPDALGVAVSSWSGYKSGYVDKEGNVYARGSLWASGSIDGHGGAYVNTMNPVVHVSPEGDIIVSMTHQKIGSVDASGYVHSANGQVKGHIEGDHLNRQQKGAAGYLLFLK